MYRDLTTKVIPLIIWWRLFVAALFIPLACADRLMVHLPTYRQIRLLCLPVDRLAWVQFIRLRMRKPARREMMKPTDGPPLLLFTLKQSNRHTAFSLCQLVVITRK